MSMACKKFTIPALFVLALTTPAFASDDFRLEFPVDCTVGQDCWVVNYMDHDPGTKHLDYQCQDKSYDTHQGTDIAIRDMARVREGVKVLNAAAGVVEGVRDGMEDVDFTQNGGRASVKGKECGNGVAIIHGKGWRTQYCHMRKGSIAVKKGQNVKVGDVLGMVGHSGLAQFPHLHIQITHEGKMIDPFIGKTRTEQCGPGPNPLWSEAALKQMPFQPTAIFNAGFAGEKPTRKNARDGAYTAQILSADSPALSLWADIYWAEKDDRVDHIIIMPNGQKMGPFKRTNGKTLARKFSYMSAKRPPEMKAWPVGTYKGATRIVRKGPDGQDRVVAQSIVEIKLVAP